MRKVDQDFILALMELFMAKDVSLSGEIAATSGSYWRNYYT